MGIWWGQLRASEMTTADRAADESGRQNDEMDRKREDKRGGNFKRHILILPMKEGGGQNAGTCMAPACRITYCA